MNRYVPCVLILAAMLASVSAATPTVSIPDNIPGLLGQTVAAPVNIDDAAGVMACQFVLSYDTNLLDFDGVALGSLTSGWSLVESALDEAAGRVQVGAYGNEDLTGGAGSLLEVNFTVTNTPGESSLSFLNGSNLTGQSTPEIVPNLDPGSIVTAVPEPSTLAAFLAGLLLTVAARRRSR